MTEVITQFPSQLALTLHRFDSTATKLNNSLYQKQVERCTLSLNRLNKVVTSLKTIPEADERDQTNQSESARASSSDSSASSSSADPTAHQFDDFDFNTLHEPLIVPLVNQYTPFSAMSPSMIMFVSTYDGVIKLDEVMRDLPTEPWADGTFVDMPVGPDGSIVAKGFGDVRVGAKRIGRSVTCFRNCVCVDISAGGGNVSIKISATNNLQAAGATSLAQSHLAAKLLIDKLNQLPRPADRKPLKLLTTRVERANYNFQLGFKLNLSKVAVLLNGYDGMTVVYDNMLGQPLRAGRMARRSDEITSQRSRRSKRSKPPAHLLMIRQSGRIMCGGPDIEELGEIYESFMKWVGVNKEEIKMV